MRALASLCFLGLTSVAHAQEPTNTFYAGAGLGSFTYTEDLSVIDPEFRSFSNFSTTAWKIYGGFSFNQYLGVEGGYWSSGAITDQVYGTDPFFGPFSMNALIDFRSLSLRGMGYLPMSWGTLFGGLGYYDADNDLTYTAFLECCDDEFYRSVDPFSGFTGQFGAQWSFSSFALRAEYEWWDIEGGDAWAFGVGAFWRF